MKRQHSGYILAAVLLSGCSYLVHMVSEMSQSWVVAETVSSEGESVTISYGLYQGFMVERVNSTERNVGLTITCLLYLNVCAWTCQTADSFRREDVLMLYNSGQLPHPCTSDTHHPSLPVAWVRERFINGFVWLATVSAVVLSGLFGLVALFLTVYNVNHTPANYWLSIRGLYFWFGSSCTLSLLALATWGVEFYFNLARNVGTVDTVVGSLRLNEEAKLGYSYWIQLAAVGLQCACLALLCYRETLFDKRPPFVGSLQRQNNTLHYTNHL